MTGKEDARSGLSQDLAAKVAELAGNKVQVAMDIYSPDELLAVKVDLMQRLANNHLIPGPNGRGIDNAVYYCTFIPKPGSWVRRETSGVIDKRAGKLRLALTVRALNLLPRERGGVLYLRNFSVKPVVEAKLDIPNVDLAAYAGIDGLPPVPPRGRDLPFPAIKPIPKRTDADANSQNAEPVYLTDNFPVPARKTVRTGMQLLTPASRMLVDGKHDVDHAVVVPSGKTAGFGFL